MRSIKHFTLLFACSNPRMRQSRTAPNRVFSPVSASDFFDQASQVSVTASGVHFRVYYTPPKYADGTVIVCHHGAGWSALTFACFSKEVKGSSSGECGVLAFDCRGHGMYEDSSVVQIAKIACISGKTTLINPLSSSEDLSIDVLTMDLVNLLMTVYADTAKAPTLLVRFWSSFYFMYHIICMVPM